MQRTKNMNTVKGVSVFYDGTKVNFIAVGVNK